MVSTEHAQIKCLSKLKLCALPLRTAKCQKRTEIDTSKHTTDQVNICRSLQTPMLWNAFDSVALLPIGFRWVRAKHIKGTKERCLLWQNTWILGVSPFLKLQNTQQLNGEKWVQDTCLLLAELQDSYLHLVQQNSSSKSIQVSYISFFTI